jgi:hypothetical protein
VPKPDQPTTEPTSSAPRRGTLSPISDVAAVTACAEDPDLRGYAPEPAYLRQNADRRLGVRYSHSFLSRRQAAMSLRAPRCSAETDRPDP